MSCAIKCWVPRCSTIKDKPQNFFPLPKDPKFKETWLALTSRKLTIPEDQVYFCERHFRSSSIKTEGDRVIGLDLNALPFHGMPEMVCRTCRTTIPRTAFFCIVSAIIPSAVPPELETTMMDVCRPEPLYQILLFCIPKLSLDQNPPSLVCLDCYYHIWQYFLFKLKCNFTETRVRGTLSPEEYGKLVLCRSCPETSSTKFFSLHETQAIGQMFKNMFITNYPSNVVPLKLCLKCYNLLNKLMLFHKQCVLADQMFKRCTELNNSETHNITSPPQIVPTIINEFQPTHSINVTNMCPESIPSTSGYSSSSKNVSQFNNINEQVDGNVMPSLEVDGSGGWKSEVDPEMPTLTVETAVEASVEEKPSTSSKIFQNSNPKKELKFSQESYRVLVTLMLKYQHLIKPDLDPIEQAKMDLEMWINVVREIHNFGYPYNLECIQSMWSEMQSNARDAQKIIGPMTYLDFLVNSYLSKVEGEDRWVTENAKSSDFKQTVENQTAIVSSKIPKIEETAFHEQSRIENCKTVSVIRYNTKNSSDTNTAINDCEIICIDDDDDDENVKEVIPLVNISSDAVVSHNYVNSKQNKNAAINESVQSGSSTSSSHKQTKRPVGRPPKPRDDSRPPKPKSDSLSLSMLRGKKKKITVKARPKIKWNVFQKLQLVRAMHKELNRMIKEGELVSFKFTPWKKIVEKLASEQFLNTDFSKLYSVWNAMKLSATIYEKDGTDIVDVEVWDLLQLYSDVQKCASNKSPSGKATSNKLSSASTVSHNGTEQKSEESGAPPCKVQKPNTSSSTNDKNSESHVSRHDLVKDRVIPPIQTEEIPTLEKETTSFKTVKRRVRLPFDEKMEILDLLEQELKKILTKGPIDISLSDVLRTIKYKNYNSRILTDTWFNLHRTIHYRNDTVLQKKYLKVLKIYHEGKIPKKVNVFGTEKNLTSANSETKKITDVTEKDRKEKKLKKRSKEMEKTTDTAEKGRKHKEEKGKEEGSKKGHLKRRLNDKERLELISIIRSFGNEVFKKKDRLSTNVFWNKVASKSSKFTGLRARLGREWGNMLSSAKLTWAQDDRTPRVGDKEIIEFMTEVIKEKEKAKEDSGVEDDKMIEENTQNDDENTQNDDEKWVTGEEFVSGEVLKNYKEVLKNVEPVTIKEEVFAGNAERKVEQGTASGSSMGSYDYVSLDDINKHYEGRSVEEREPVAISEVIEIPDSDEE